MRRPVVGVVGSDDAAAAANARELGRLVAEQGWVVVSGGRDSGVMRAVNEGAAEAGGLTVGILPDASSRVAPGVQVVVVTDLGHARNNVIVLSSDVVVACGVDGAGTASEVALAVKNGKPVILLAARASAVALFQELSPGVAAVSTPRQAIDDILKRGLIAPAGS